MAIFTAAEPLLNAYSWLVRGLVLAMTMLAGAGIVAMMLVTCCDVIMRAAQASMTGAVDVVRILGALTMACALPYTTAVKGHVAIEYFFLKLSRPGRVFVDTLVRLLGIALFVFIARQSLRYGQALRASGEVTATLQIPIFWVLYVMAFSCGVVAAVILHHLLHPGKELIKP